VLLLAEKNLGGSRMGCGSGFTREESNAVYGTGLAGVRG